VFTENFNGGTGCLQKILTVAQGVYRKFQLWYKVFMENVNCGTGCL
jgi:hypothetical protein